MVLNYFEIGDEIEASFKNSQLVTNGMIQQVVSPDAAREEHSDLRGFVRLAPAVQPHARRRFLQHVLALHPD